MSDVFIGLLLAAGVGAWVYNKINQRTGGSNSKSIATAAIAAILAFMTMITILRFIG